MHLPCRAVLPQPVAMHVCWNCVTSWPLGGRQILPMWSSNFSCLLKISTATSLNKELPSKFGCRAMAATWTRWTGFGWLCVSSLQVPTSTFKSLESRLWNRRKIVTLRNLILCYWVLCAIEFVSTPALCVYIKDTKTNAFRISTLQIFPYSQNWEIKVCLKFEHARTHAHTHTHTRVQISPVSFPNYYLLVLD